MKKTITDMINLLAEIREFHKNNKDPYHLYNLLENHANHLKHLIEAKEIHKSIQREIKEDKYSRWKQL